MRGPAIGLLVAVLGAALGAAQTPPAEDPDLARSVRRIGERLAQVRGEAFDRPPRALRSPDVMTEVVVEARAYRVVAPERLRARGRGWNDIGLGGPASPELLWLTLAADLSGIDLDAEGRRLLVSPERLTEQDYGVTADEKIYIEDGAGTVHVLRPDGSAATQETDGSDAAGDFLLATGVRPDEPLLAHYLMHLRQLERNGQDTIRETTDALLAASAWAEGEANLVALYFLFDGVGMARTVLTGPLGPGDFLGGQLIPEAVRTTTPMDAALLGFVYDDGYDFAAGNWRRTGWGVFLEPAPQSTAELLYPERPFELAPWPEPLAPREGLELRDTDRLGPWAIRSLVSIWTGSSQLSMNAARGWRGDRLTRWERSPEDGVTVWETRWGSEAAARVFADAFSQVVRRRDPGTADIGEPEGQKSALKSRFRLFRIARDGSTVRILVEPVAP